MTAATTTPTVFVAAVDGTGNDSHVIEVATWAAKKQGPSELHLVHVVRATPADTTRLAAVVVFPTFPELLEERRKLLVRLTEEAALDYGGRVVGHVVIGEPWREIVQTAAHLRADMIVVGTADRTGLQRMFLGSVAARVVRKAQCPVLVARRLDYAAAPNLPEIEPPCVDCLTVQRETARAKLWCERHTTAHTHGRLHYETPPVYGAGSMLLRP